MTTPKHARWEARLGKLRFLIETSRGDVGWHLSVYNNGTRIRRHLENSLDSAKEKARFDYAVPEHFWKKSDG